MRRRNGDTGVESQREGVLQGLLVPIYLHKTSPGLALASARALICLSRANMNLRLKQVIVICDFGRTNHEPHQERADNTPRTEIRLYHQEPWCKLKSCTVNGTPGSQQSRTWRDHGPVSEPYHLPQDHTTIKRLHTISRWHEHAVARRGEGRVNIVC